ncbi:cytochrome aa3 quinol oxidase subunit II [Bacillus sp. FJAT-42376]|uniref:cytochrome aa3 quinol oxidase subunit II n=1 Tax=Bacillus sp. FJAT-42376 TaxID=2014076 RepID=UPI000F4D7ED9|nr:cytochrome aa3 quinol oxidase subunit II [Bacillus sp. FJAT-42376]AZB44687.1 cytochrome aa3 quinol oxidase subunit II [Bacillus sp. FJAT-42376]
MVNLLGKYLKPIILFGALMSVFLLGGCSQMAVLDPKGPVAAQQRDLIMLSIVFMLLIIAVVFVLFVLIIIKYRERPTNMGYEPPEMEGSKFLEIVWTVIPIIIVIALSIPTVQAIYSLEEIPESEHADKKPLVVYATSVDWKWIFSYPEENIETVNQLYIPEDRPIEFRLTSADNMASFWIPQLGGQKYAMSEMEMKLYLQADEPGTYEGRNANFTGEGFTDQRFKVYSQTEQDFAAWVEKSKSAPKLKEEQYEKLMFPGHTKPMTFSSTHLKFVDHAKDAEYAERVREKYGVTYQEHSSKDKEQEENDTGDELGSK